MTSTTNTTSSAPTIPAGRWTIDPAHSEVGFAVRHLGLSRVRGQFREFSGSVESNGHLDESKVSATIKLASVDTNNEQRDGHLLSADFFDVEKNQTLEFRSTNISVDPSGVTGTVTGELTLGSITRTVELATEFNGIAVDAYGVTRAGFSATTTLSRKDFGIEFNVPLDAGGILIGDKATVELEIQLIPAES